MAVTRVRFSPAPTGYLHLGSARSALYNWMFARHESGEFLIRVEDTDRERSKQEYIDLVFRTLEWLGLDWDGEPVLQSTRGDLYAEAADRLHSGGNAYYCDCTREVVEERTKANATPGYDGFCRERGLSRGPGTALRFRTPNEGTTEFDDAIRGNVSFENANLEDFVIQRADGTATFFLPNAVDDIDMGITHVIRGEDLVNVTPKVLLIRHALGHTDRPLFAHLPLIVNEQRKKLSKRRDDVALEDYKDRGYLPEAMRNYLALLGWAPGGGREIVPIEEMIAEFRLEAINKSAAFFDPQKLDHVNGEYVRALDADEFVERTKSFLEQSEWFGPGFDAAAFRRIAPLVQERVKTLSEVPEMVEFLFVAEPRIDESSWEKAVLKNAKAAGILDAAIAAYETCDWKAEALHSTAEAIAEQHELKLGKAQAPIRVAITGRSVGPPLFESLEILGRDRVMARLHRARASIA